MHEKVHELNRQFTQEMLIIALRIPQIVQDFDGSEDDPSQVQGWIAAAATIGNAVGGLVPGAGSGISAGFGILVGIFSAFFLTGDERKVCVSYSAKSRDKYPRHYGLHLPSSAPKRETYETKIAKFLHGGWFLVDDDEEAVHVTIESSTSKIQKKVANDVMKAAKYHLVADKRGNVRTREGCGFAHGQQWLELKDGE
ncbi:hypothetical protein FALCPG4_018766 [Fusarium falciforme]